MFKGLLRVVSWFWSPNISFYMCFVYNLEAIFRPLHQMFTPIRSDVKQNNKNLNLETFKNPKQYFCEDHRNKKNSDEFLKNFRCNLWE